MITTEGLATTIKCGKNGIGTVAVTPLSDGVSNTLTIRELAPHGFIEIDGNPVNEDDITELPSVTIHFYDPKSIDTFIKQLEVVKRHMTGRIPQWHLAC